MSQIQIGVGQDSRSQLASGRSCGRKFCDFVRCINQPRYPRPYTFSFDPSRSPLPENKQKFESNFVRTSKYSLLSFFPKALLLQFTRLANVYFLLIAVLLTIPIISPLNPLTAWAPLIFVLCISMIREGFEDFSRIKADRETNFETKTHVFRSDRFIETNWSDIVVGDVLRVEQDELFPADLILLCSSNNTGAAFIQTASMDGQKNLKPKNAFQSTLHLKDDAALANLSGQFMQGGIPNPDLNSYSGRMSMGGGTPILYQGAKQLLYRGTRLKNTKWIHGLAVQTGRNTKIVLNSKEGTPKISQIETKVNYILGYILLIQGSLCLLAAILQGVFQNRNRQDYSYIYWDQDINVPLFSFITWISYFVLLNTMIPISLVVSIQIVKVAQMIFIEKDKLMESQGKGRGVSVKAASLNEELGQIEYVFTDKTGTLTNNIMEFKIAIISDQIYGDLTLLTGLPEEEVKFKSLMRIEPQPQHKGFFDSQLLRLLEEGDGEKSLQTEIVVKDKEGISYMALRSNLDVSKQFFFALAVAHEVISDVDKKGNKIYQGPSPDQVTLVDAARSMGYEFIRGTQEEVTVMVFGKERTHRVLEVFGFSSQRKRMSILIEEGGILKMYIKGADNIIKKRLSAENRLNLDVQLSRFSNLGLRTLLIALRLVSHNQYNLYRERAEQIARMDIKQSLKDEKHQELISDLEHGFFLIGATAVLDRLQDEVPSTIRDLIRANIKVWMLTGDKMETAENIAKSCNLIQEAFEILRYRLEVPEGLEKSLRQGSHRPGAQTDPEAKQLEDRLHTLVLQNLVQMTNEANLMYEQGSPKALLIEGSDLTEILRHEDTSEQLVKLSKDCQAVVCCRLLPSQKAEVVRVVRKYLGKITLAIGDGANDVPMIKQAHIGIGLFGEEGMNAVQASDYALPQFRMLWRLLLVHGRWNYIRISDMILYFFYKNMIFTFCQFLIGCFNGFSAQTIFDEQYVAVYNLMFTSVPLLFRAVFEQDINYIYKDKDYTKEVRKNSRVSVRSLAQSQRYLPDKYRASKYFYRLFPKIYFVGQENLIFNFKNYLAWVMQAVMESVIITLVSLYMLSETAINGTGLNPDYWSMSQTIFSCVILIVTFKLATHTRFWTIYLAGAILLTSIGLYLAHMWITNTALSRFIRGTTSVTWTSAVTYLIVLLAISIILVVDGLVVFLDFRRGGYASRMRTIVKNHKMEDQRIYSEMSLSITQGLTEGEIRRQF